MPHYRVRYNRKPNDGRFSTYSEGEWREITMVVDTEEEAIALAEERLAEQFPDDGTQLSQSNYNFNYVEKL